MPEENVSYEQALNELQSIIQELQDGKLGMDALKEKVTRAATLIRYCKDKLRQTSSEINTILGDLN